MKTTTLNTKAKQAIGKNYKNVVSASTKDIHTKKTRITLSDKKTKTQNPLLASLVVEDNTTFTENGAVTFKSTLNSLVDFFAMGGAVRIRSESEVIFLFSKAYTEDALLATKLLFHTRNSRGGSGERKTFRICLNWLSQNYPQVAIKNLTNVGLFGRYDDLIQLLETEDVNFPHIVKNAVNNLIEGQLDKDIENYNNNKPISLLAKWMPSENTSSAKSRDLASAVRRSLGWTSRQYRKTLSALREYLNVTETLMSSNDWSSIDFSKVPSKASLNYKKAFMKHEATRYQQFITDVKIGTTKINASGLFPYEIIEKVQQDYSGSNQTLDILWDALPDYMEDKTRNMLVVADVSGSMEGRPMAVSISLAIYAAQHNKGSFANYFITYSDNPTLQKVVGNNIREKVRNLQETCAYGTDLQKVFVNILSHAVKNKVSQEDMPSQVVVVSDMELNSTQNGNTNHEAIEIQYKNAGYEMPNLVYWNVASRQNNVPATADQKGVLLVSGASPSVFKTLMTGKQYTPVDQMLETLNQKMYDVVLV